jgi:DNA-binding Xre family transcriptional regulator
MAPNLPDDPAVPRVLWRLPELLEEYGITRHRLAQAMQGKTSSRLTTLYRMADPKRIDLSVLAEIITALRALSGLEVGVGDVLEYVPDDTPQGGETPDAEIKYPDG